ncbi:hypothetical protein Emag_007794 [Eimeria magna]
MSLRQQRRPFEVKVSGFQAAVALTSLTVAPDASVALLEEPPRFALSGASRCQQPLATRDAARLPPQRRPARSAGHRGCAGDSPPFLAWSNLDPSPALRQLSLFRRVAVEAPPVPAALARRFRRIFDRLTRLVTVPCNYADLRACLQAVKLGVQALHRPADAFHIITWQLHPRLQAHIRTCMTAQPDPIRTPYEHMVAILMQQVAPSRPEDYLHQANALIARRCHTQISRLHMQLTESHNAYRDLCAQAPAPPPLGEHFVVTALLGNLLKGIARNTRNQPSAADRLNDLQYVARLAINLGEHRLHGDNTLTLNDDFYGNPASAVPPPATPAHRTHDQLAAPGAAPGDFARRYPPPHPPPEPAGTASPHPADRRQQPGDYDSFSRAIAGPVLLLQRPEPGPPRLRILPAGAPVPPHARLRVLGLSSSWALPLAVRMTPVFHPTPTLPVAGGPLRAVLAHERSAPRAPPQLSVALLQHHPGAADAAPPTSATALPWPPTPPPAGAPAAHRAVFCGANPAPSPPPAPRATCGHTRLGTPPRTPNTPTHTRAWATIDGVRWEDVTKTGADLSLISADVLRPHRSYHLWAPAHGCVTGMNNHTLQVLGRVALEVRLGTLESTAPFFVGPGVSFAALWGVDFLYDHEIAISLVHHALIFEAQGHQVSPLLGDHPPPRSSLCPRTRRRSAPGQHPVGPENPGASGTRSRFPPGLLSRGVHAPQFGPRHHGAAELWFHRY